MQQMNWQDFEKVDIITGTSEIQLIFWQIRN